MVPDYGDAKPAVDVYLKVAAANSAGLRDPSHPDMAVFDQYTEGQAHEVMVGSIQDEVEHGTAWRGTPWTSRVEVQAKATGASSVILTDCPLPSASWVQYDVATGRTVPQKAQTPPPPYLITIVMNKAVSTWAMISIHVDGSKTCTR